METYPIQWCVKNRINFWKKILGISKHIAGYNIQLHTSGYINKRQISGELMLTSHIAADGGVSEGNTPIITL